MKNKITTIILTILICVFAAVVFTACGKCKHVYDNACDTTCNKCDETREVGEHTPEADDGDCTTEITCRICGTITTPAGQHTPNDDDGDCTTAIKCKNCDKDAVAGNTAHSATDTDGDWKCDNPGCEQLIIIASEGLVFEEITGENDEVIGYSVTGLGTCTDTDIVIPATVNGKPVTAIGGRAFYECSFLTSVTIPDSVTEMGMGAFMFCEKLTSVTIPASVKMIGDGAFQDCTVLKSVFYGGTQDEWTSLNVNVYIIGIGEATVYYYSDTQPTTEGNYWHYDADGVPTTEWDD